MPCPRWAEAQNLVATELPLLARALIATRTGTLATKLHDCLSGSQNSHRLVLRLLNPPGHPGGLSCYAWDITGPALVQVPDFGRDEAVATYPFGVEVYYQDFVALLEAPRRSGTSSAAPTKADSSASRSAPRSTR